MAIAEQFNKLKQKNEDKLLSYFDKDDLKEVYMIQELS